MADKLSYIKILFVFTLILNLKYGFTECVHEQRILGSALMEKSFEINDFYVEGENAKFTKMGKQMINPLKVYNVQFAHKKTEGLGDFYQYNKKYIEYYRYGYIHSFLNLVRPEFTKLDYRIKLVGLSVEGRDLFRIMPRKLDPNKKTIVMFGRHHGDEGTANWIIEGFVNSFLAEDESFHDNYQLILYPMVNPDGAEAQTRYNKNGRDLNRSWSYNLSESYDEAKIINSDLRPFLQNTKDVVIVLDMHGSFTEDFIYRVKENFVDQDFFDHQQEFIDVLASFDRFQQGNFKRSNGHPKMARIVMVDSFKLNALTHETPRDIKLKNSNSRSKKSLKEQGAFVLDSIKRLY